MSIQLDIQDLDNYPGTSKRVTLDTDVIIPTGMEGDEKYLLVASTSAYSDNDDRTSIQDLYVVGGKIGWTKSSGFAGTNGKFILDSDTNTISVKMDETTSGTGSTAGYYDIVLDHDDGVAMTGEDIAVDMQEKIRAIEVDDVDEGYQLAYTNASVKFEGNKFWISSGSISSRLTGSGRSSVLVGPGSSNDCYATLGFDRQVSSMELASISLLETTLYTDSDYTADTDTLVVNTLTGISAGDALHISDTENEDYFTAIAVSSNNITVATSGTNGFTGISHDYTADTATVIQVLSKNDPDNTPDNYYSTIDGLLRYMAKIIINQVDFSS